MTPTPSGRPPVNRLFTILAERAGNAFGVRMGMVGLHQEVSSMARLVQRYIQYRHVGFGRVAAIRFAWLVVTARAKPGNGLRLARRS
jgi:hypothetical protein